MTARGLNTAVRAAVNLRIITAELRRRSPTLPRRALVANDIQMRSSFSLAATLTVEVSDAVSRTGLKVQEWGAAPAR